MIQNNEVFNEWKRNTGKKRDDGRYNDPASFVIDKALWSLDSYGFPVALYNEEWSLWWKADPATPTSSIIVAGIIQDSGNKPGEEPKFIPRECIFLTEEEALESMKDSDRKK